MTHFNHKKKITLWSDYTILYITFLTYYETVTLYI